MLISITCNKTKCANKDVTYLLPPQEELVMCGGCKTMIEPVQTDIPEPKYKPLPIAE